MISESQENLKKVNRSSQMDVQQFFDKTLLKLNDLSLESMNLNSNEDIQMREIGDSDYRPHQDIYQQIIYDKRESLNKSRSVRAKSKIQQQPPFLLDDSKKKGSAVHNKLQQIGGITQAQDKQHQCFCANTETKSCQDCFCLAESQPCIFGVCCQDCYAHKNIIANQIAVQMLEKSQKKRHKQHFIDIDTFISDRNSFVEPMTIQQPSQSIDDELECRSFNKIPGKKVYKEEISNKSPEKTKKIRKASDSVDSKSSKKQRSRKKIFTRDPNDKLDQQKSKPYPIIPPQTTPQKISQKSSPTKSGKRKGLGVTLKQSGSLPSQQSIPEKKPVNKIEYAQEPVQEYRCHCSAMNCRNRYCGCFRMGKACSVSCVCADCQNGYENVKRSGPKVYLENSGSGINHKMQFEPVNFDVSQKRSMTSSNKSRTSKKSIQESENKLCSCLNGQCVYKGCACFKSKERCSAQCKCLDDRCKNRRQMNE